MQNHAEAGGAQHPERGRARSGEQEHGHGEEEPDRGALLSEGHLVVGEHQLPLPLFGPENPAGGAVRGDCDDKEGRSEEAVDEEHDEHDDVVGLKVLEVLEYALAQPPRRSGDLKMGRLEEVRPGAHVCSPLRYPLHDAGRGHFEIGWFRYW